MRKAWSSRLAVLLTSVLATGGLLASGHDRGGSKSLPAVSDPTWAAECGACHQLYHPGLLPARSWRAVMGGLAQHFGQNADLDTQTRATVERFLVANAADRNGQRRSERLAASIPAGATPLRISETPYIVAKHAEVRAEVFGRPAVGGRANCAACHAMAAQGGFSEADVRIPKPGALAAGAAGAAPAK